MRICALMLLAGCNRLLGLVPTREIDAPPVPDAKPDAVGCSGSKFANTVTVPIDVHTAVYDPTQSDDPLEIFFTLASTTSNYQVATSTRPAVDQPFSTPTVATFGRTNSDGDPSITSDGLHIVFLSNNQAFQTDRADRHSAWSNPTVVPGIDQFVILGADVTLDGLTIYFSDFNQLRKATRTDVMAGFDPSTKLAVGMNITFPTISPDERELFYNPKDIPELHRMTRNDPSLDFDPMTDETLLNNGADPDISSDSRTMLYVVDGVLTEMHRDCP